MINVTIMSARKTIFTGKAKNVILPGEWGVFEILPFHNRLISRLIDGHISVDGQLFSIARGIVKVDQNSLTALVEE